MAKDSAQIVAAVDTYAATGVGDIKGLQGVEGGYRIRVRSRRVLVDIIWTARSLTVTAVRPRGDAY